MRAMARRSRNPAMVLTKGTRVAMTDGRTVVISRRGQVYQLNPSGAFILSALLDGGLPHAIHSVIRHYGISAERARVDVTALAGQLRERELVRPR